MKSKPRRVLRSIGSAQHGGFFLGVIVGLLVGLALALGVALYVSKVPAPFVNKVPQRGTNEDAAEAERNKHWDPNGSLAVSAPAGPASGASAGGVPDAPALSATASKSPRAAPVGAVPGNDIRRVTRDPAAILGDEVPGIDSDVASTETRVDPFTYFVQTGAYVRIDEAEQQRVRMTMLGYDARVTEREHAGRTVYRVRVGPYEKKDEAAAAAAHLKAAGVESALVRVQR